MFHNCGNMRVIWLIGPTSELWAHTPGLQYTSWVGGCSFVMLPRNHIHLHAVPDHASHDVWPRRIRVHGEGGAEHSRVCGRSRQPHRSHHVLVQHEPLLAGRPRKACGEQRCDETMGVSNCTHKTREFLANNASEDCTWLEHMFARVQVSNAFQTKQTQTLTFEKLAKFSSNHVQD